jgi:serine/threonine-protein kinase
LPEAAVAYREALRLKPNFPEAHSNLGAALSDQGKYAEAEAEYREGLRLRPNYPEAHNNLGNALAAQGKLREAAVAYKEAIRLKPDYPEAHCSLGQALRRQGRFAEAVSALRRGHELGSKQANWPYPSAAWVREAKQLAALDAKLFKVLRGAAQPADAAERLGLAKFCQQYKKRYATAARFYAEAFAGEPKMAEDLRGTWNRYNAACAAALAGCGQGADAVQLDDKERARLRRQALDWLRADLRAWAEMLEKGPARARAKVQQALRHWQRDADFAGVRGDKLAKLPQAERQSWQRLWADVEQTLRKVSHADTKDTTRKPAN